MKKLLKIDNGEIKIATGVILKTEDGAINEIKDVYRQQVVEVTDDVANKLLKAYPRTFRLVDTTSQDENVSDKLKVEITNLNEIIAELKGQIAELEKVKTFDFDELKVPTLKAIVEDLKEKDDETDYSAYKKAELVELLNLMTSEE